MAIETEYNCFKNNLDENKKVTNQKTLNYGKNYRQYHFGYIRQNRSNRCCKRQRLRNFKNSSKKIVKTKLTKANVGERQIQQIGVICEQLQRFRETIFWKQSRT